MIFSTVAAWFLVTMYRDRTAFLIWKATVWPRHVVAEEKCYRGRAYHPIAHMSEPKRCCGRAYHPNAT